MTVEEINKALEGVNLYEGYVKKDVFDKTASEVAEWKKETQRFTFRGRTQGS